MPLVLFHLGLCGGLSSDVTAWARGCLACQQDKIHCHKLLVPLPISQRRFSHLYVDLVGPLQYSNNFNYIFTIIDHMSKWMEAIPLSETFVATCVKALTFTWIYRFGVSKTIFLIVGCNLCPNLWLQLCEMLNISNKQNNVLSQTVQSKGCTAASRTRFAHMPLQQHGPRNYPLYSLELEHSRGKTLVFPQLRQFSVHKLSCQMNFCKMTKFQLTLLSKKFPISCMFLLLLCLGTILVLTCLASC